MAARSSGFGVARNSDQAAARSQLLPRLRATRSVTPVV